MELCDYWRSSAAYRVRIALNLKGLAYSQRSIDLVAGAQHDADYARLHPGRRVPALILEDGTVLIQSLAILRYLDASHPEPPLWPRDALDRARVEAAAHTIAMDIHPVNNSGTVARMKTRFGIDDAQAADWMRHWMGEGLGAFQALVRPDTPFCFGAAPGLADVCLIPQLYNARRWGLDMAPLARLAGIEGRCLDLPAFDAARPENQPDAKAPQ